MIAFRGNTSEEKTRQGKTVFEAQGDAVNTNYSLGRSDANTEILRSSNMT